MTAVRHPNAPGHHRFALLLLMLVIAVGDAYAQPGGGTPMRDIVRFDRALLLERQGETSANVSIGDLNRDGHLDIVLVKGRHWPLLDLLLLGDGAGGFAPPRPLGSDPDRSYSGVLVDLDRDGDLDIVVSNDYPDPKRVYLNDGAGSFTVGSTFGVPQWPTRQLSIADLNKDGFPDAILANRYGNQPGSSYICFGREGGRFAETCSAFASESATNITPADFDGDGHLDLAVPHREGGQSYIYLNAGDGTFSRRVPFGPADAAIRTAEAADFNRDGVLDLVVIDERRGPAILWGQAKAVLGPPVALDNSGATPYALSVADLNGDEIVDVIVGNVTAMPVAFFGDGKGGFAAMPFGDDQGTAYGFAVADVDRDGFMDIAMARSDAPNVLYFGGPERRR